MKKISKVITISIVLLLLVLTPVILIKWINRLKAKEINVLLEYEDNGIYPNDYPIVGVPYTVFDGLDQIIGSGITDELGMITIFMVAGLDLTGLGIHVEYKDSIRIFIKIMWQGALVSINNLMPSETAHIQEFSFFVSQILFTWDGITPLSSQFIDIYFEGEFLTTEQLGNGILGMWMLDGTYTFKCAEFYDYEFVLDVNYPATAIEETITVSAQFTQISCEAGGFLFF